MGPPVRIEISLAAKDTQESSELAGADIFSFI